MGEPGDCIVSRDGFESFGDGGFQRLVGACENAREKLDHVITPQIGG
jgi:hypothetical protein